MGIGKKSIVCLLVVLLLALPVFGEEELSLTLPMGKGEDYIQKVDGKDAIALPIRISGSGLNTDSFLQSGQLTLHFPEEALGYLGSSQELNGVYSCYYQKDGVKTNQPWVLGKAEQGKLTMAFASGYPCHCDEVLITLYFQLKSKPAELVFSITGGEFALTDKDNGPLRIANVGLGSGKLSFTTPVTDYSALKKEYDRCYGKLYDSRGNLSVTVGEAGEIPEGEAYLTESQLKKSSAALTAAKKVLDDEGLSQGDVDKALSALKKDFISPVEAEVDFSSLADRIDLAQEKVDGSDFSSYSGEYQNKWRSALRKAKSVYTQRGKGIHSQNEVDEAEKAIVALVSVGEGLTVYYLMAGLGVSLALLVPLLRKRLAF